MQVKQALTALAWLPGTCRHSRQAGAAGNGGVNTLGAIGANGTLCARPWSGWVEAGVTHCEQIRCQGARQSMVHDGARRWAAAAAANHQLDAYDAQHV